MNVPRPRAPLSLYLVVGVLALLGVLMLARMIMGFVYSFLALAGVLALLALALSVGGRRGSR